jgi:serine/threonine-protein kinase
MAPEQFRREALDARADVYALGCVLYAALTGAPPFPRATVPATMLAHMHDAAAPPSATHGVPRDFDRVLARALAKAPDDRYPSAGDLGRAARAAAEGRSVTEAERSVARGEAAPHRTLRRPSATLPLGERDQPVRRYRSRPRRLWAAVAAVAAFAAALAMLVLRDDGAPPAPGGSLSSGEVERLARSFARAYETEDPARLSKLLTSDVQRVTPADRQSGRPAVLAAYKAQFAQNDTTRFDLSDVKSDGGPAARTTARYRATYRGAGDTTGSITFDAIRERGKPKIVMILARPD